MWGHFILSKVDSVLPDVQSLSAYNYNSQGGAFWSFKIIRKNCYGHDVHKTSFTKGLNELCSWLAKYGCGCTDICMDSTGKYWIPVFNILEKNGFWVTLSHPKYTKPQKGNRTGRKDTK